MLGTDYIKDKKSHKYKTTELVGFSELKPAKMVVDNFNSYSRTSVDKQALDIIVRQGITSWKAVFGNVSVITLQTVVAVINS